MGIGRDARFEQLNQGGYYHETKQITLEAAPEASVLDVFFVKKTVENRRKPYCPALSGGCGGLSEKKVKVT